MKLTRAYGNVKLLLQNKNLKLDKLESLNKMKKDEKLTTLVIIITIMGELKSLAEKHNLETKLYGGGGLEKILNGTRYVAYSNNQLVCHICDEKRSRERC